MENESSFNQATKPVTPAVIIAVLVGVLIGGVTGYSISKTTSPSVVVGTSAPVTSGSQSADYKAGFEAARAKLVEKGIIPNATMSQDVEMMNIGGTVKNVSGNTLMVEVPSMDILGDATTRTVVVTANTVISQLVNKTPEAMEVEMKEFMAKNDAQNNEGTAIGTSIEPPQPFSREKVTIQNIKEGSNISITSEGAILESGDITAKTVDVFIAPVFTDIETPDSSE